MSSPQEDAMQHEINSLYDQISALKAQLKAALAAAPVAQQEPCRSMLACTHPTVCSRSNTCQRQLAAKAEAFQAGRLAAPIAQQERRIVGCRYCGKKMDEAKECWNVSMAKQCREPLPPSKSDA